MVDVLDLSQPVVQLDGGAHLTFVDDNRVFPFESLTLPNVTWTTPLVNAPVPINKLKLNFQRLEWKSAGEDPTFLKRHANRMRDLKTVEGTPGWLHTPLVSLFFVTTCNVTTINSTIKEDIFEWKSSVLGLFTRKQRRSNATAADGPTPSLRDGGGDVAAYTHSHSLIGTIIVFCPCFEEEEDGVHFTSTISDAEKQRQIQAAENALKQICVKSGGNPTYELFKQVDAANGAVGFDRKKLDGETREEKESSWGNLMFRVVDAATKSFSHKCNMFKEAMAKLESMKESPGWNVSNYFLMKESLALMHIQVNLVTVALQLYSDIKVFFNTLPVGMLVGNTALAAPGSPRGKSPSRTAPEEVAHISDAGPRPLLSCHMDPTIRSRIRRGTAGLMDILGYLFAREVDMLEFIGIHDQIHMRAEIFLRNARVLYRRHGCKRSSTSVEPIDVWTIALVVAVCDKVQEYNVFDYMSNEQRVHYSSLLMIGRASAITLGIKLFGVTKLPWLDLAGKLQDPTQSSHEVAGALRGEGPWEGEETVPPHDIRVLALDKRTEAMVLSPGGFTDVLREWFLLPAKQTYDKLGEPHKRHAVRVLSDLAGISIVEQEYDAAATYFQHIDAVFIADGWKEAEAINTTWLAFCYRKVGNTNQFIDAVMSLVDPPVLEACPDLVSHIMPRLLAELPRSMALAGWYSTQEGVEGGEEEDATLDESHTVHATERRAPGQGFLKWTIDRSRCKTRAPLTASDEESSGGWTLPCTIYNRTAEELALDQVQVNIRSVHGVNARKQRLSKPSLVTANGGPCTLVPGDNTFEFHFTFSNPGVFEVENLACYVGKVRFDLDAEKKPCRVDIFDPVTISRPTLQLAPLYAPSFTVAEEEWLPLKVDLEYLSPLEEAGVNASSSRRNLSVLECLCVPCSQATRGGWKVVSMPSGEVFPMTINKGDAASLMFMLARQRNLKGGEGEKTVAITVKYRARDEQRVFSADVICPLGRTPPSVPLISQPPVFSGPTPSGPIENEVHASIVIPKYGIVGDHIPFTCSLHFPSESADTATPPTERKYVIKSSVESQPCWMIRGYKTKVLQAPFVETLYFIPMQFGRLPVPVCRVMAMERSIISPEDNTAREAEDATNDLDMFTDIPVVLKYAGEAAIVEPDDGILIVATGETVTTMGR